MTTGFAMVLVEKVKKTFIVSVQESQGECYPRPFCEIFHLSKFDCHQ